jgi:transposase
VAQDWRDKQIAELKAENATLRELVAKLEQRVEQLEARLGQSSSNSSQAPSRDTPEQRRARPKKKPTGRKKGAQPGHEAHQRELVPPEKVSRFEDHFPDECEKCGTELPAVAEANPLRHQVAELPKIEAEITEHRLHAGECQDCGHITRAKLPPGVPRGMLAPRLLSLVGLLTGPYRVSRRLVVEFFHDVMGMRISLGALSEAEERVSEAIAPAVEEATDFVRAQPVKHVDATGWSQGRLPRALWTVTTTMVTVFAITRDGSREAIKGLLSKAHGLLVSDRATVFLFWAMKLRQICWAHLMRKFAGFAERRGAGSVIARDLLGCTELIFHNWHRIRDGTMSRREFQRWMSPVRERVEWLLERGAALNARGFSGSCRDILKHREALWTFVDTPGVEPTNNCAERDLRPFVQWRKTSYGCQSDRGERYAERIMTVTHTLRKQRRNVFEYLHQACANALFDNPPPSLLPLVA